MQYILILFFPILHLLLYSPNTLAKFHVLSLSRSPTKIKIQPNKKEKTSKQKRYTKIMESILCWPAILEHAASP